MSRGVARTGNTLRFSARVYLLALIAAAVVPVWLFAAYVLFSFAFAQQQAYRSQAELLARQISAPIETELSGMALRLDGLARSSALSQEDFPHLQADAKRLVANSSRIVSLRELGGREIFNTSDQQGGHLPSRLSADQETDLLSGRIVVSNVYSSAANGELYVAVARPVIQPNGKILVLAISVPTTALNKTLVASVPTGWVVGIADRSGVYVTRSSRHSDVAGKPGLPAYLALAVGASGSFESKNQFGETLLAGYFRSDFSGWLYAANVPLSRVAAPLWRSLYGVLGIGAFALAISLALAFLVGKRLTKETQQLASRASAVGALGPSLPYRTSLSEFAVINQALIAAGAQLHERERELKAVVDTVPAGVWFTYDPSARRVIRNRFAAEMMGISTDETHGFGVPDMVIDTVALKDGKTITREDRPLTRAMRGEHTDNEEFSYLLPDGRQRYLLSSARPILGDTGGIIGAVQISLDISDRKQVEQQRDLLTGELNHRVKNSLAMVQALANQTLRNSKDLSTASVALNARLSALGRAHDLLTKKFWTEGEIREVLETTVLVAAPTNRILMEGPDVALKPKLVMALTLAMHELTTNAIKYGALSERSGEVSIRWKVSGGKHLKLRWIEAGGPPVTVPERKGFGSRLLEGIIAGEGGSIQIRFAEKGLQCDIRLPLEPEMEGAEPPPNR
jgi:PAS domain S-box-containing protein